LNETAVKASFNNILKSNAFHGRELHLNLLNYLINASLEGKTPKEVTIAIDVFNKAADFNASDNTTVRVQMHNLRKKLELYYENEGALDPIRFYIPKGKYHVDFVPLTEQKHVSARWYFRQQMLWFLIFFIATTFFLIFDKFFIDHEHFDVIEQNDPIWGKFFNNSYPTSLVIGDYFSFNEWDNRRMEFRRIQDIHIHNFNEYQQYANANPDRPSFKWSMGELPHPSIFNAFDIQLVFLSFKQKFDLDFTTEIDINFTKNRNFIYLGDFLNLRVLKNFIDMLPVKCEQLPWFNGTIQYQQGDSLVILKSLHDIRVTKYIVDLGIAAKLPGQNNENYFIFAGISYDSQVRIPEAFSKRANLKQVEKNIIDVYGSIPDYFVVVFEVKGFDRGSSKAEIKYVAEIEKDFYLKYNYEPAVKK
jgi:hypothetical protein